MPFNATHVAMLDKVVDEAITHPSQRAFTEVELVASLLAEAESSGVIVRVLNELGKEHPGISDILRKALAESSKAEHIAWLRSQMTSASR